MTLLSIDEIQIGLDNQFLPLEPMLTGYRLIRKATPDSLIDDVERKISVKFPDEFRDIVSNFDFGKLTIGPVVFCAAGDYFNEIVELNTQVCWWGDGQRPSDLIMIGNSDPFAILLNVHTGSVFAMDSETGWQKSFKIAGNFYDFFLGLGTVMLMRNETADRQSLAKTVCASVGSDSLEFWFGLAQ